MWQAEQWNIHKGAYLSASTLARDGCARQLWYERQPTTQLYENPRRRFWPFRGTLIHSLVEGAGSLVAPFGWMQELRMSVPLAYPEYPAPVFDEQGVWTGEWDSTRYLTIEVGGTTDAYNPFLLALHDFKTIGDGKISDFLQGKQGGTFSPFIKDEWVWQVNIYSWLIRKTRIEPHHREQFEAHRLPELPTTHFPRPTTLQMQLISMMEIPFTGRAYVPQRSYQEYVIDAVPVLSDQEIDTFVRDQALTWYRWLTLGEQPPVVAKKKAWMCKNCPFNGDLVPTGTCFPESERT